MPEYRYILKPSIDYLKDCGYLLLNTQEMANFLQIPPKAVQQMVYMDRIPLPVRLKFCNCMRWNVIELLQWVQAGCPRRTEWIRIHGKSGWYKQ
jgi:hypothetical protein